MVDFATFVQENRRLCRLCAFFEAHPDEAESMRKSFGDHPTKVASVIADYLIKQFSYHITPQNVHDHFRRGHEVRKVAA